MLYNRCIIYRSIILNNLKDTQLSYGIRDSLHCLMYAIRPGKTKNKLNQYNNISVNNSP